MKKLITAAVTAITVLLVTAIGLLAIVVTDDDAQATEIPGGGGGLQGVPAEFQPWILKAANACKYPELVPALLAAQLNQESGFRTDHVVSDVGAQGPAQFMPGTWSTWGRDDDHNGDASPFDIGDAVMAQGRMMCSLIGQAKHSGITGDVRALALAGYNAGWARVEQYHGVPPKSFANGQTYDYVQLILSTMPKFQGPGQLDVHGHGDGPDALRKAAARIGTPYSWGGGSPQGPSKGFCDGTNGYQNGSCVASSTIGFDCSSLTQYAYWPNIKLPRTAADQYRATADHPVSRSNLKPGDLLFWAHGAAIYHVAMYAGDGNVLQAPRTGRTVSTAPLTSAMPESDYVGATRP
ncbi:peptidase [Streptomyces cellostaticus]|uniref:Peptidase n=1 Tax=Streptomyces cellostaticus TaxID=67285 RepID=A0A101NGP0_9ACTN|nr:bifunctional lytic transglycosylase/C40 family peptidase [Streptomyces cellostaticus]KUM92889.1 peptidase [Streptomyces cellostaticus]GHI04648.1 transglycosylase [Streptomyces cellostaticus]